MEPNLNIVNALSEANPETMDVLSKEWCNFAMQALQQDQSMTLLENSINMKNPSMKLEKPTTIKMEYDPDVKSIPSWKSNDVKSWIWMQQAMHPELNYNSFFRKKWAIPFKSIPIKKWLKEIKLWRKEEDRLQRAEVHAAISLAGVAAALSAIADENLKESTSPKEAAVASAAALVATQCAKVAEAMGAKREQLEGVIGSAMSSTNASDIITLTAAAKTSVKGATTLKARTGCKNRLKGIAPVLPIEDSHEIDFDLEKCRLALDKGAELGIETPDGNYVVRLVSVIINSEGKVVLQQRKLNLFQNKKESIILDLHAELYKDSKVEENITCYLIALTTSRGIFKIDIGDDFHRYKTWAKTISHMLTLSSSVTKYDHHFHKF